MIKCLFEVLDVGQILNKHWKKRMHVCWVSSCSEVTHSHTGLWSSLWLRPGGNLDSSVAHKHLGVGAVLALTPHVCRERKDGTPAYIIASFTLGQNVGQWG